MNWIDLNNENQLGELVEQSNIKPVIIYKHSSRCSISAITFDRLNRGLKKDDFEDIHPYFLDIINYRDVSDEIASRFGIRHQSPQIILIKEGRCVYDDSHFGISGKGLKKQLDKIQKVS